MQDTNTITHASTNTTTLKICHQYDELEAPRHIQNSEYVVMEMGTNQQRKGLHTAEKSETSLYDTLAPKDDKSMAETIAHCDIHVGLAQISDAFDRLDPRPLNNVYDRLDPRPLSNAYDRLDPKRLSDTYDRLDTKTESDNHSEMAHSYTDEEDGKLPAMSQKHLHVYDEINSHRGNGDIPDVPVAICTCISESSSKTSTYLYGKVILERSLNSVYTSTLTSNVETHIYDTIDDPKQTTCNTVHQTNTAPNTCTCDVIDTTSDAISRNKHTRAGVHFFYQRTLECDNAGLDHTIHGHNITIRIPEGAVPPGDKLLMKVGVTLFGPFTFPENFWPISPLLQLCPSEIDHYEFKKPLTVILPHFLSEKTIEKLTPGEVCFAKANHNYSEENGYKFELIDTKPMFATSGPRNFGVLQIQHCCYLCLLEGKNLEGAEYNLVRIEKPLPRSEIHFLVTYCLDTCLQALDEQYPPEKNNCQYKTFQFASDSDNLQMIICTDHSDYVIALNPKSQRVSTKGTCK